MKIIEHPNGFLRIEFFKNTTGESDRLHIWDKPGEMDTDIHQHSYSFHSTVLAGVMREDLYSYRVDPKGEWERWLVRCGTQENGEYTVEEFGERVRVTPVLQQTIIRKAGDSYYRPAADFHMITAVETPLITRVQRGRVIDPEHFFLRHGNERRPLR